MNPYEVYEKLAEANLTIDQALDCTDSVIRKIGEPKLGLFGGVVKGVGEAVHALSNLSAPLFYTAVAMPPAVGYMGGKTLAKQLDAGPEDVAEIQERELIAELQANAEAIRRRRALRQKKGAA